MQSSPFATHLKSEQLAPLYLLHSDVPLLLQEARDQLIEKAKKAGFLQRELHVLEPGFSWDHFLADSRNLNLFGDKTILDFRNPTSKFDDKAQKALVAYAESAPTDKILIITSAKLTSAQQRAKWVKKLSGAGECFTFWPVTGVHLPQWINKRLRAANLQADSQSVQLLAELTEGNLLATKQAVEKLRLLYPQTKITAKEMLAAISDNARFSVFDLSNAVLQGDVKHAVRILAGLKQEGMEPVLINWALTRELRELIGLRAQMEAGASMHQLLTKQWASRKSLLQMALRRLSLQSLHQCLQFAAQIDLIIKGMQSGNAWDALSQLACAMAGHVFMLKTARTN